MLFLVCVLTRSLSVCQSVNQLFTIMIVNQSASATVSQSRSGSQSVSQLVSQSSSINQSVSQLTSSSEVCMIILQFHHPSIY